jgi:hypothetical protein
MRPAMASEVFLAGHLAGPSRNTLRVPRGGSNAHPATRMGSGAPQDGPPRS